MSKRIYMNRKETEKRYGKVASARVRPEIYNTLKLIAAENGVKLSVLILDILTLHIEKYNATKSRKRKRN